MHGAPNTGLDRLRATVVLAVCLALSACNRAEEADLAVCTRAVAGPHTPDAGAAGIDGSPGIGGAGGGTSSFGFFVFSDMHVSSPYGRFATAVSQMALIDPAPIAGFATGDFTDSATASQWACNTYVARTLFDPNAAVWGGAPRYLGASGNHDVSSRHWYGLWASNLAGQAGMGHSGTDGIYFTTTYGNALFAFMDSNKTSGSTTSWNDAQTRALAATLASSKADFKFMFFHKPVYSCYSGHSAFADGLPWIDLAEKHNVDVIFSGHTHVYTRTCRMHRASCRGDGEGTVQVEIGTVGSTHARSVDVRSATVKGTDSSGDTRKDTYNCASTLVASRNNANDFCYVRIDGCQATISCYLVAADNTTPFDTWTINHCQPSSGA